VLVAERIEVPVEPESNAKLETGTIELSRPFEEFAPWPGEITAPAIEVPHEMPVFAVVLDQPLVDLEGLKSAFGVDGVPFPEEEFGGVWHLVDADKHLYLFRDGAADLHVLEVLETIDPMTPMEDEELWDRSQGTLSDLGLLEWGPVEVSPVRTGDLRMEITDGPGAGGAPWTTLRSAFWAQRIDGWPAFGPCSEIEVGYGRDRELAIFSHCMRRLEDVGRFVPDAPEVALERYLERARLEGYWTAYLTHLHSVESLEITAVTLGYWLPESGDAFNAAAPFYEIQGVFSGLDEDGSPVLTDMLWYEPALADLAAGYFPTHDLE